MPRKVPEAEFRAVYEEWCQGSLRQKAAAARLGMSGRTFRRYAAGLRAQGSQWWEQRPRPRPASRRAPDEERERLQRLYLDHYADWNVRHFHEKYLGKHGGKRSYTWVKDELQAAGLLERRTRGGTGTTKPVQSRGDHQSVDRMPREGMLLHLIAARHEWTPGGAWDLILTVDDATNRVHSGFFVEKRGIWSIFRGIRETLECRGTFGGLNVRVSLPDRLTASYSAFGGSTADQVTRAISDVCPRVSTEAETCTRQVRLIGTLRERLPRELAAKGIAGIDSANEFLAGFWPEFNASSGNTTGSPSAFEPLSRDMVAGLVDVLCLKHDARIDSRNRLFCRGREVRIPRGARQRLNEDREYRVHEYEDGSWKVEGHVQQADNADAYARARVLGCTFLENGAVRCPKLTVLNENTHFASVEDMPPPRKPRRLEDQSSMIQGLVEMTHHALAAPDEFGHLSTHEWNLGRYVLENLEAEDAMARAGCETMEDACADAVRASLGWTGLQSPGTAGLQDFYADRDARIEELGIVVVFEVDRCELEDSFTVPVTVFDPIVGFTVHTEMTVCDHGECGAAGVVEFGGTWNQ